MTNSHTQIPRAMRCNTCYRREDIKKTRKWDTNAHTNKPPHYLYSSCTCRGALPLKEAQQRAQTVDWGFQQQLVLLRKRQGRVRHVRAINKRGKKKASSSSVMSTPYHGKLWEPQEHVTLVEINAKASINCTRDRHGKHSITENKGTRE